MQLKISALQVGQRLRHAIRDQQGVLLLMGGVEITSRLIEGLRRRGIDRIVVHPDDSAEARAIAAPASPAERDATLPKTSGVDVGRRRVGCQPHDLEQQERLRARFSVAAATVRGLAEAVVHGELRSVGEIHELAAEYVQEVLNDCDQAIALALGDWDDCDLAQWSLRLSVLGIAIGLEMDLSRDALLQTGMAGLIHDWGLLKLPQELRSVDRELSGVQLHAYQKHPLISFEMLEAIPGVPGPVRLAVLQLHEQIDGSGYPQGLTIGRIHRFARILNLADAYLRLTSPLGGGAALSPADAIRYLLNHVSGGRFDASAMRGLLQAVSLFPIGSLVELSDQTRAMVIRSNGQTYDRPIVQAVDPPHAVIDLSVNGCFVTRAVPRPKVRHGRLMPEQMEQLL